MVKFQSIPAKAIDVSEEYFADLSSDQKYLLEMYQAVSSGLCQPTLASLKPGKMTHSRWLSTALRALKLYVSTEKPSCNFKLVVRTPNGQNSEMLHYIESIFNTYYCEIRFIVFHFNAGRYHVEFCFSSKTRVSQFRKSLEAA